VLLGRKEMNADNPSKSRSLLVSFGLVIIAVGFLIAFAANISMDPNIQDEYILLSALGRIGTGIAFQLLGLSLVIIGKK